MNKNILNIILVLLWAMQPIIIIAQQKVQVLDKFNHSPLDYATVYFPDTKTSAVTDTNGFFELQTHHKSVLMQISSVGYKTFLGTVDLTENQTVIYMEPALHELQDVTVSANSSRLQGENVLNVEKINLKTDSKIYGISLSEKLTSLPGVSNYSTGSGIGKPVIRGLTGNRIAVYAGGVRMENQQWGDEHGLGLDENGSEHVEIIKGAASLLYGSDAIGGVVYFADERYAKNNTVEILLNSEYQSNTTGFRNAVGFKFSKNRWHINLFGAYTTHKDYKDGFYNSVINSRFQTGDMKFVLGYTGKYFTTLFKYNYLNELYGLTEGEEDSSADEEEADVHLRTPQFPVQGLQTHIFSSESVVFLKDKSKLKWDINYIFNIRREFEEDNLEHLPALDMRLGTLSYNLRWYSATLGQHWNIVAGSQGFWQVNQNQGVERLIPDASTANIGIFSTADYHYKENAYLQFGLRTDYIHIAGKSYINEADELQFPTFGANYFSVNFSTGIYQPLSKEISVRLNIASGFRAPNMYELLSDGVHEGTNRYEIGNQSLKTENSYQADFSLDYQSKHVEVFVNPYFNYIRHYIYLQPQNYTIEDMAVYNYAQNHALLYGGEAGVHFHPHPVDWLHVEVSYSNTFGQQLNGSALPLLPAQKLNSVLQADFSWNKKVNSFSLYVQYQYTFAQNQVSDYEQITPDYHLLNAGFSIGFVFGKQKPSLQFSVNNILNTKYFDHLSRYKSEGILNMGRNFVVKLNLPLVLGINRKR
ncbi:MAG: TonB-dependent receptor [Bacteroidales bacterium]|jgi:iron complex outermembrane receptor protein|nr:TonB-dependent receptor [Bacteroidales bacterium]